MMRVSFLFIVGVLLLTGCVRRVIDVRSDPEGVRIFLDGVDLGQTPLEIEFDHYGVRELVFRKAGYETARMVKDLHLPWWQVTPVDFFTEILYPGLIEDIHPVFVSLSPQKPADDSGSRLLKRAEKARALKN